MYLVVKSTFLVISNLRDESASFNKLASQKCVFCDLVNNVVIHFLYRTQTLTNVFKVQMTVQTDHQEHVTTRLEVMFVLVTQDTLVMEILVLVGFSSIS